MAQNSINHKNPAKRNRRDFLKKTALTGLGAGILSVPPVAEPQDHTETKAGKKKGFSPFREQHNQLEDIYEIDPNIRRMDQKNIVFARWGWDPKYAEPEGRGISFVTKMYGVVPDPLEHEPGFSQLEHSLEVATWGSHDAGTPLSAGGVKGSGILNDWNVYGNPKVKKKYKFKSKQEAAKLVKRASRFLGADEVGIAPYDERWVYSKWYDATKVFDRTGEAVHEEAVFPFEPKSVIAFTFEMDYDAVKTPGRLMDAAAGLEYSSMAEVGQKVALFLNGLGYKALPTGNDTAMSIPIAAQAGLGELSRMGTLISEKYGSRVRLAKVFTDLEMQPDKPISFGVTEFCIKCKKCAEQCPSNAISVEDEPSINPTVGSISNHPGVKKWHQDADKCFSQWEKFGSGCGICLAVCPYNKVDNWVHDLSKLVVSAPVGRDIARQLDDAFGYGNLKNESIQDFWNKED